MKERPILFSAPMIRALLAGAKTQTRRIVKPRYDYFVEDGAPYFEPYVYGEPESVRVPCPYGLPGDRLWAKETHALLAIEGEPDLCCAYRATCDGDEFDYVHRDGAIQRLVVRKWRPSIHMPRLASRITLEVTSVRLERLQEISEEDAKAEGVETDPDVQATARDLFMDLWCGINGTESWDANPWVWVVSFRPTSPPGPGERW